MTSILYVEDNEDNIYVGEMGPPPVQEGVENLGNCVTIFSPKGDIYALRKGSTPIDFAYEVHTDLGDTIIGCKVNRSEVPLNIELETGQTVETVSYTHLTLPTTPYV